jgi:hypothetical protein
MVIEPEAGAFPSTGRRREAFAARLLSAGAANDLTRTIQSVLFHRAFPVDIRHNAKIRREVLAQWAQRRLGP